MLQPTTVLLYNDAKPLCIQQKPYSRLRLKSYPKLEMCAPVLFYDSGRQQEVELPSVMRGRRRPGCIVIRAFSDADTGSPHELLSSPVFISSGGERSALMLCSEPGKWASMLGAGDTVQWGAWCTSISI